MKALLSVLFLLSITASVQSSTDADDLHMNNIADRLCNSNLKCKDIVIINLQGEYREGLNEKRSTSIGTLINNKQNSMKTFCSGNEDAVCESYKQQLILHYIKGLLSR